MKQFLYRLVPVRGAMLSDRPDKEETAVLDRHFDFLKGLAGAWVILPAGRTVQPDRTAFGIVILRA